MHTSVFLEEAVEALNVENGKKYIDATFGEGGHARQIQSKGGIVLGIDADKIQATKEKEIKVVNGNYGDIRQIAEEHDFIPVAGILFDFGLSMVQLKTGGKGLSYKNNDEPLDMRLGENGQTAAEYLNSALPEQLVEDITKYSEDLVSNRIAHRIVRYRSEKQMETVGDLKKVIDDATGMHGRALEKTYARIFQAVRIIVNDELTQIRRGLEGAYEILEDGGRIVIISFHSIEDRVVKAFVRSKGFKQQRIPVQKNRKLQTFERSATLRVIEKI